jgi:hypothetical protein
MSRIALDLDGQRFGRLIASNTLRIRACGTGRERQCVCDCGSIVWVQTSQLNHTKSCGCLLRDFKRLPDGRAARNEILDSYKRSAAKRGLVWQLSDEQFDYLTAQLCFYCSCPPSNTKPSRRDTGAFVYNGIDRVDNTKGYMYENVVPACNVCNRAKSDMTIEDFLVWIQRIKESQIDIIY